jgi:hypothetical protein
LFAEDQNGTATSNNYSVFKGSASSPLQTPIPQVGQTFAYANKPLGEIHFANGKAFIVVTTGLTDAANPTCVPGCGGLLVIDLANPDTPEAVVILESTSTGRPSRIVHLYIEPEGEFAWANNDGPSGNNEVDSVFRINVNPDDSNAGDVGGEYLDYADIQIGNGHHKLAMGVTGNSASGARRVIYISSLTHQTIHVIDHDKTSGTFGQVIKTIRNVGTSPHGMDYSPNSGRAFSGITGDAGNPTAVPPVSHKPGGLMMIDGTKLDAANIDNFPVVNCTPGGTAGATGRPDTGGTPIVDDYCVGDVGTPGAGTEDPSVYKMSTAPGTTNPELFTGYLKVLSNEHDEDMVYASGRDGSIPKGWVTAIEPGSLNTPPSIDTVIDLGDRGGNSFAHGGDHHAGKLYLPSSSGVAGNNDEVIVIWTDHDDPGTFNTIKGSIEVGGAPGNLRYSKDGRLVLAPVTIAGQGTVKVIDTETDTVIDTLTLTTGNTAGNVGAVALPFDGEDNH